ncbi:MAG: serine/threonine protein kinase, partial [Planctomycetota bacterium]|nr:serine/threonine protein kinase [Planctomycetota bacterium]
MLTIRVFGWSLALFFLLGFSLEDARSMAQQWTEFRGPGGSGIASATNLPSRWSEGQNVRWKKAVPGRGWSSPVVSGGQV